MPRLPVTASRRPGPVRQYSGPQPAKVHSVTAEGLMFTLDEKPSEVLGPARWQQPLPQHVHTNPEGGAVGAVAALVPPERTPCLIAFVGTGVAKPWVLVFSGWPA